MKANSPALTRLMSVHSDDEALHVLAEEPSLLTLETDQMLAQQEKEARKQGQKDVADALGGLRKILADARSAADFKLPDIPGSYIAADLVHALTDARPNGPIPAPVLSDVFFTVISTLRQHGKKHNITALLSRLDALDRLIKTQTGGVLAKPAPKAPSLLAMIEEWMDAPSWESERVYLAEHKELLSEDTTTILTILRDAAQKSGPKDHEDMMREHLDILARVRKEGIEPVYEEEIKREEAEEIRQRFQDKILARWLDPEHSSRRHHLMREESPEGIHKMLLAVAAALDVPDKGKRSFHGSGITITEFVDAQIAPADIPLAQELFHRVLAAGGEGCTYAQEGLLTLVAAGEDPACLPFWRDVLASNPPHDRGATKRRSVTLAALARLAIRKDNAGAIEMLRSLAHDRKPEMRRNAVYYLGQVYLFNGQPIPADIQAELTGIAVNDRDFATRFDARTVLHYKKLPIPLDNPGSVYTFHVRYLEKEGFSRTIAIKAEQTLQDLHNSIQTSINWDNDHMYSFYMTADESDSRYEIVSPDPVSAALSGSDADMGQDAEFGGDKGLLADEVSIGELGLGPKSMFTYLFDYGDQHLFFVKVVDIHAQTDKGKYPRVVAKEGRAPKQYQEW